MTNENPAALVNNFEEHIDPEYRQTDGIHILQVNIGKICNLRCKHCHVMRDSHNEIMSRETIDTCIEFLKNHDEIDTLDITGGEPTMHPDFHYFVEQAYPYIDELIIRTNATFLQKKTLELYEKYPCTIFISMPCYTEDNTDRIRGNKVFDRIVNTMAKLNEIGYGVDEDLPMHLVHNPLGANLPPEQAQLEKDYKEHLGDLGVEFTNLVTITNMPLGYFENFLHLTDSFDDYMALLKEAYNPETVPNLMCRFQLSVGWDGQIYDCDFNQMCNLPIEDKRTIYDVVDAHDLERNIVFRNYCYGCTAGSGSSCGGQIDEKAF